MLSLVTNAKTNLTYLENETVDFEDTMEGFQRKTTVMDKKTQTKNEFSFQRFNESQPYCSFHFIIIF